MTTATLALRIDAPMQSWGVRSRFTNRFTATEPTKSGVVGLLAAACGVERTDDARIRELADLRMGVRVEREGLLERDYHVTQDVPNTKGKEHRTIESNRYYLADALFLVVVEGAVETAERLDDAVRNPHWPLFFGRKAFVPAAPLIERDKWRRRRWGTGVHPGTLEERLEEHPWLENRDEQRNEVGLVNGDVWLRTVADVRLSEQSDRTFPAELRHDHPESFAHGDRRFRSRPVCAGHVKLKDAMITGVDPCS
ncbi:CRISPR system Cascade subunit CasD [Spinactinospora alkalitolerans]|uniref:CRISPR system Cascade subunit CasD n=1 Tax=Spinactinospora alkalitolerans TaxID=687207 RepID=A0A852U3F7_9ACTN|nr:type I-E CRISPR-associated protein Cas5/CasD [Spinactinospora alkalitolerans]NYE50711.1 CRISPR system Cascade subunit CasD [Spinactinospora alkalitolerans]